MTDRRFICPCEDVCATDIDKALKKGLKTIEEIKRYTGLGTGPCQGKECLSTLVRLLLRDNQSSPEDLQPFTSRPPAESVTFGSLASIDEETLRPREALQRGAKGAGEESSHD